MVGQGPPVGLSDGRVVKIFVFRCSGCMDEFESGTPIPEFSCPRCGGLLQRVYSTFSVAKSFQPHFNHSVGQYVRSASHYSAILRQASAEQSEKTGMEVRLEKIDVQDCEPPPGAGEMADQRSKILREQGKEAPKKLIVPMKD